jgi:two-component system, response regulator PdtaR
MRVLIVEDEALVALDLKHILEDSGFSIVGIAADSRRALEFADHGVDAAMVDCNLRDGLTGPRIGEELVRRGVSVMFMTANPAQLGAGVPGAVGVLPKPVEQSEVKQAAAFLSAVHQGQSPPPPPARLMSFMSR